MMLKILSLLLAGSSVGSASIVSPSVKKSDKAFFGKDYPFDKRPSVDVLHFKHPYPVVQDSDEFDRDFVKDENKDNGEYAAQKEMMRREQELKEKQRRAAERKRGLISGDHEDTKEKGEKDAAGDKTRKTYAVPESK